YAPHLSPWRPSVGCVRVRDGRPVATSDMRVPKVYGVFAAMPVFPQLLCASFIHFDEESTMQAKIKRCILGCTFGVSLVVAGCQTVQTTRSGEVGVDRSQQMSVFTPSPAEVDATARQQYLQVTRVADQKGALNRDPMQ